MSTEELDANLDLILESLPEFHEGVYNEKRKHALTRSDMELILSAIRVGVSNQGCSLHLTKDQSDSLVSMIKERKRILALIGSCFIGALAYVGQKLVDLMDPNIWKKLGHWIGIGN